MAGNSYFEQLERIAAAMENVGDHVLGCLKGQSFDFATDDGVRAAVAALVIKFGGEVRNA